MPNKIVQTTHAALQALLLLDDPVVVVVAPLGCGMTTYIKEAHPDHVREITGEVSDGYWNPELSADLTEYATSHAPCVFLVDADALNDHAIALAITLASDECQIVLRTGPNVLSMLADYPRITLEV